MKKTAKIKKSKRIVNFILVCAGSVSLGLGAVGIILPLLPATPFLLLTLVCYAKGSTKFERWFTSTKLYKKHLEPFVKTRAMTNANKIKALIFVTVLISVPIITVDVLPMRIFLGVIILAHYLMFIFKVKSVSKAELNRLFEEVKAREAAEDLESQAAAVPESESTAKKTAPPAAANPYTAESSAVETVAERDTYTTESSAKESGTAADADNADTATDIRASH
ncbi:MAG: YbaN family protein [Clostridiales bacterium]|jgi:uncharacterized membrane protein YbaN (DUF454 family)|nr:YbaN family protein [Clostridiales bacterium]